MQKTKLKILRTTIELFNKHGFANVSLPQIAGKLNISLGNLTYHYPKKDQLIMSIYEVFLEDLKSITKVFQNFEDLKEMDLQLRAFYQFQQVYRFFYLDLLELGRAYPVLAKRHEKHIEEQIEGLYEYFLFNISIGTIANHSPKTYHALAKQLWMTVVFWSTQLAIRGVTSTEKEMVETAWLLLQPYLTPKGKLQLTKLELSLAENN
ncbi:MAG: TetR/AcrR family transcriptional regulator [Chitinophagales bacterium]